MIEKSQNKAMVMGAPLVRNKTAFFYPEHQVTVEAKSKEEADEKVKKVLEKLDGKEKTE